MAYVDGFLIAVETARKDEFLKHAEAIDSLFLEYGASRITECWGDDVKHGEMTDFYRAVAAKDGETVVFSWIEWPDKPTRDAAMEKIMGDARMQGPMPFDGKRMIFGGFTPVYDRSRQLADA